MAPTPDATILDELLSPLAGPGTPGVVAAITRHGEPGDSVAHGMADLAHGIPLDSRTVMRIGSQTKQFTVLLALLLERDGLLSLGDPVDKHLPGLAPAPAAATLRDLAANTSGVRDFLELLIWSGLTWPSPSTRADAREIVARHNELNFPPGEQMLYSNSGFLLLGDVLEHVTGERLGALIRDRLTGPLGMDDTVLQPRDAQIVPGSATHHTRGPDGAWERAHWGLELGGEGGLSSTLEDMLRWQAFLTAPPAEIRPILDRMAEPARFPDGSPAMYGLGLVVTRYRGLANIGHGGGVAGGRSESVRFPATGLGVVVLGNRDDIAPFALARRVADRALHDALGPPPSARALAALSAAAGLYRQEDGDDVFEIVAGGGTPAIGADATSPLIVTSGGAVTVEQRPDGRLAPERPTTDLVLGAPGDGAIPAWWCGVPRRYRRVRPGTGPAESVAGSYMSPVLGADAVVSEDATRLVVRTDHGALRLSLAWIEDDLLLATQAPQRVPGQGWDALLRVTADGLLLHSDRTRGLRLVRVR